MLSALPANPLAAKIAGVPVLGERSEAALAAALPEGAMAGGMLNLTCPQDGKLALLARLTALQTRLLDLAATLVKPGGRLVYVTCSLLDEEGSDQAEAFLSRHPAWSARTPELPAGTPRGRGLRLSPAHDATDGFFIACFGSP